MGRNRIQPANYPLAYYLTIPQWRCSRGHWNDVSRVSPRCYGCCDEAEPCLACGGDGEFHEGDMDRAEQCRTCSGWGVKWDWPTDDEPTPQAPVQPEEPF